MLIEKFVSSIGGVVRSSQARHDSGKYSTNTESANSSADHTAAARYHDGKDGIHHTIAAEAHRTAADAHDRNHANASDYSENARQASRRAAEADKKVPENQSTT